MQVWFLGWEDALEKGMATHSSILAWRIPWTEEPGGLQSMGSQRVGHDWSNLAHTFIISVCMYLLCIYVWIYLLSIYLSIICVCKYVCIHIFIIYRVHNVFIIYELNIYVYRCVSMYVSVYYLSSVHAYMHVVCTYYLPICQWVW